MLVLVMQILLMLLLSWHRNPNMRGFTMNDGMETGMLISRIFNNSFESVRIDEFVATVHGITVTRLLLRLNVACVLIVDSVRELVMGGFFSVHRNGTDNGNENRNSDQDELD